MLTLDPPRRQKFAESDGCEDEQDQLTGGPPMNEEFVFNGKAAQILSFTVATLLIHAYAAAAVVAMRNEGFDGDLAICSSKVRDAASGGGLICLLFLVGALTLTQRTTFRKGAGLTTRLWRLSGVSATLFWAAAAHEAFSVACAATRGCPPPGVGHDGSPRAGPRGGPGSLHDPSTPNVLMLIIDDLRYDGGESASAPHTRSLLQGPGVTTFPQGAYAAFPVCAPSRTALFLGMRPSTTTMVRPTTKPNAWNRGDLPVDLQMWQSLPGRFREAHRATYSVGKVWDGLSFEGEFEYDIRPRLRHDCPNGLLWCSRRRWTRAFGIVPLPTPPSVDDLVAEAGIAALRSADRGGVAFFIAIGFHKPHLGEDLTTARVHVTMFVAHSDRPYPYREGGKMIMHQNRIFATPSTPHPGQPKPNPAYLDQYGGCCKRFWGQVGEV